MKQSLLLLTICAVGLYSCETQRTTSFWAAFKSDCITVNKINDGQKDGHLTIHWNCQLDQIFTESQVWNLPCKMVGRQ